MPPPRSGVLVKQEQIEKALNEASNWNGIVDADLQPPPGMPGAPICQDWDACMARPQTPPRRVLEAVARPKPAGARPATRPRRRLLHKVVRPVTPPRQRPRTVTEHDSRPQKCHKSSVSSATYNDWDERNQTLQGALETMQAAARDRADTSVDNLMDKASSFVVELSREACHAFVRDSAGKFTHCCRDDFQDNKKL